VELAAAGGIAASSAAAAAVVVIAACDDARACSRYDAAERDESWKPQSGAPPEGRT
jgi:hypothetical protein